MLFFKSQSDAETKAWYSWYCLLCKIPASNSDIIEILCHQIIDHLLKDPIVVFVATTCFESIICPNLDFKMILINVSRQEVVLLG